MFGAAARRVGYLRLSTVSSGGAGPCQALPPRPPWLERARTIHRLIKHFLACRRGRRGRQEPKRDLWRGSTPQEEVRARGGVPVSEGVGAWCGRRRRGGTSRALPPLLMVTSPALRRRRLASCHYCARPAIPPSLPLHTLLPPPYI